MARPASPALQESESAGLARPAPDLKTSAPPRQVGGAGVGPKPRFARPSRLAGVRVEWRHHRRERFTSGRDESGWMPLRTSTRGEPPGKSSSHSAARAMRDMGLRLSEAVIYRRGSRPAGASELLCDHAWATVQRVPAGRRLSPHARARAWRPPRVICRHGGMPPRHMLPGESPADSADRLQTLNSAIENTWIPVGCRQEILFLEISQRLSGP